MTSSDKVYDILRKYTKALTVALGYRDPLTQLHSDRVMALAEELGRACDVTPQQMSILKIAASFHDVGKIGIPDPVLLKPGSFNDDEWDVMKRHPHIGADIIAATDLFGADIAADVIRHHHEHWDGSGYPDGQQGENISLLARIISIVDAYDAMAMTRSYHQARKHEDIMDILRAETGRKFDPRVMAIFEQVITESPHQAE